MLKVANSVISASRITGTLPVANGGTGVTTSTGTGNTVLSASPTFSGTATFNSDALINGLTVGRGGSAVATNTALGASALTANTSGTINTAIGSSSGSAITTGAKNTFLGAYTGNSNGLDIRASSNNVILSDGDGNPTNTRYKVGDVSTTIVDIAPSNTAAGGLHFVSGFNTADGSQAWFLIATRVNSVTTISSSNNTGLTITFSQTSSVRLNAVTTSGTINLICTTIS